MTENFKAQKKKLKGVLKEIAQASEAFTKNEDLGIDFR